MVTEDYDVDTRTVTTICPSCIHKWKDHSTNTGAIWCEPCGNILEWVLA